MLTGSHEVRTRLPYALSEVDDPPVCHGVGGFFPNNPGNQPKWWFLLEDDKPLSKIMVFFFPGWEGMQPTSLVKIQGFGDVGLKGGWQLASYNSDTPQDNKNLNEVKCLECLENE